MGQRRRRRARARLAPTVAAALVLALCAPLLLLYGADTLRNSTEGRRIDLPTDPAKPRFEATVEGTPSIAVLLADGERRLHGIAVLSLHGAEGGAVTMIPASTSALDGIVVAAGDDLVDDVEDPTTTLPAADPATASTLATKFATSGIDGVRLAVAGLLGTSVDEAIEVGPARWASLLAPVSPLTIVNPDAIATSGGTTFPAGPVELTPETAAEYLVARNPGESELARLARQGRFITAWLSAVAERGSTAVVGETTSGIGRFVAGLSAGEHRGVDLPWRRVADHEGEAYELDPATAATAISRAIPYPTSAHPGQRVPIKVLDGVASSGINVVVAALVVPLGAEITHVGNADNFDYETTRIEYHDEAMAPLAARFVEVLGFGEVVQVPKTRDEIELTVVIGRDGRDALAAAGALTDG